MAGEQRQARDTGTYGQAFYDPADGPREVVNPHPRARPRGWVEEDRCTEQWGVGEGSAIELVPRGDQVVLTKRSDSLAEMMARVTPDNLHSELDTGPRVGEEGW